MPGDLTRTLPLRRGIPPSAAVAALAASLGLVAFAVAAAFAWPHGGVEVVRPAVPAVDDAPVVTGRQAADLSAVAAIPERTVPRPAPTRATRRPATTAVRPPATPVRPAAPAAAAPPVTRVTPSAPAPAAPTSPAPRPAQPSTPTKTTAPPQPGPAFDLTG